MARLKEWNRSLGNVAVMSVIAVISMLFIPSAVSIAVMSVDLGSEFIKIAVVKPGIPMEIVLNKDSRRKSAYGVSFKDGERQFGDAALGVSIKQPANAFLFTHQLLGKSIDHEMVKQYQKRFPFHNLVKDPERGTVMFESKDLKYTPEEILGMVLNYTRHAAEAFADHAMKDIVITVPAYFNQAERRAVVSAAKMVGLNVLQLMNDNTAVALNYGIFRSASFNGTEKSYMFVDIGASSTTATIVGYSTVKVKDRGYLETVPQLTVKGVGFDPALGGVEIDFRLRDHLVKLFKESTKTKGDIAENPRAMAKLLKEAKRVKQVLSANTDHRAQVEGLFEEKDFRAKVTRQELEDLCADLIERIPRTIENALKSASMSLDDIESVILMGGGTRMPKVQETLLKAVKKSELGKNINTDEAAALGSVYKAADLSAGFKVKRFIVKDANMYPIDVSFERHTKQEDGTEISKTITRTLFHKLNVFPQKKVMTFNKMHNDFIFNVTYGDLTSFDNHVKSYLDLGQLHKVSLTKVEDVHVANEKLKGKGIKVYFNMDDGGILHVDKAEAHFEKSADEVEEPTTFQKLGNTLSNLFGGGKEEPKDVVQEDNDKKPTPEEPKTDEKKSTESKPDEKKDEKDDKSGKPEKEADAKTDKEKSPDTKTDSSNTTSNATADTKAGNETSANSTEPAKPKGPILTKEPLSVDYVHVDTPELSPAGFEASVTMLTDWQKKDEVKLETERARNMLESFIFEFRDKLEDEMIVKLSTSEEREKIASDLSKASDWLDDEGYDANAKAFTDKLRELRDSINDLDFRIGEYENRPVAIKQLMSSVNLSNVFLSQIKLMPDAEEIYKEKDLEDLRKARDDAKAWLDENWAKQNKTSLTVKPVMLSKDIIAKNGKVDRELLYLINKAKYYIPKKKPKTNGTTDAKANKTTSASGKNGTTTADNVTMANGTKPDIVIEKADGTNDQKTPGDKIKEKTSSDAEKKASSDGADAPKEIPSLEAPSKEVPAKEAPSKEETKEAPADETLTKEAPAVEAVDEPAITKEGPPADTPTTGTNEAKSDSEASVKASENSDKTGTGGDSTAHANKPVDEL